MHERINHHSAYWQFLVMMLQEYYSQLTTATVYGFSTVYLASINDLGVNYIVSLCIDNMLGKVLIYGIGHF